MRLITENDERPHEELEHTRETYASNSDLVRALERSGALRTPQREPRDEPVLVSPSRGMLRTDAEP